jgi:hypothetical protein
MLARSFVLTTVAILGFIVAAWSGGDAAASGIDPCYRWCYILHNRAGVSAPECNRRCRASPRYVCDSKCVHTYPNSPRQLRSCQSKCTGLTGPYS